MFKTTVTVEGMACSMCEAHLNDAVRNRFDVKKVTSSRRTGKTEILSETVPDAEILKAVIEAAGYRATDVVCVPYEKRGLFSGRGKRG